MKKVLSFLTVILVILCLTPTVNSVSAQGETKVVLTVADNKTEVEAGDTFKVYIEAEDVIDLFGLQLSVNYDSKMIQVVDDGVKIEKNMEIFGGKVEDLKKGSLTYPFINTKSSKDKQESMPIADITFKALEKGPVVLTLTDIKAVNSDIRDIHNNTQYQTALNIKDGPIVTPPGGETEKPTPPSPEPEKPSDNNEGTTKPNGKPSQPGSSGGKGKSKSSQSDSTVNKDTSKSLKSSSSKNKQTSKPPQSVKTKSKWIGKHSQLGSLGSTDFQGEGDRIANADIEKRNTKADDTEEIPSDSVDQEEDVSKHDDLQEDKELIAKDHAKKSISNSQSKTITIVALIFIVLASAVGYFIYMRKKAND